MTDSRRGLRHPAWLSALAVGAGYGLLLLVMTAALFLVPFVVFSVF